MKTTMTLVGAVLMSYASVHAQQRDTTSRTREIRTQRQTEQRTSSDQARESRRQQTQTNPTDQASSEYRAGELRIVQPGDIPAELRTTLQDERYKGWENAIIYHNTRTGEYMVSPRPYRFDSSGKAIEYDGQYQPSRKNSTSSPAQRNNRSSNETKSGGQSRQQTDEANSQREQNDSASEQASQGQYGNQTRPQQPPQGQVTEQQQASAYRLDSTATPPSVTESADEKNKPQNPEQYRNDRATQSDRTDYNQLSTEGMTLVPKLQYPASLKKTLRSDRYKGWEEGTLYRDNSTGEYLLIMEKNGIDNAPANYRFDENGKALDDNKDQR